MNQIFLLPLIGLLTLSSAQAADGMFVFNDAESFVVARSYNWAKLTADPTAVGRCRF